MELIFKVMVHLSSSMSVRFRVTNVEVQVGSGVHLVQAVYWATTGTSIYTSVNSMLWDSVCCMLAVEEAYTQQLRYRQTEEYKIVSVAYV